MTKKYSNIPPLYKYDKEPFRTIANHEAGHYVIAKALGFETGELYMEIFHERENHDAGSRIYLDESFTSIEDICLYCTRRIQVLFAGVIAESINEDKTNRNQAFHSLQNNGESDYIKIKEVIRILRNIKYPNHITEHEIQEGWDNIYYNLFDKAELLVNENMDLILRIGTMLLEKITEYNKKFTLCKDELDAIPELNQIKRYNC